MKTVVLLIICLMVGTASGYYIGAKQNKEVTKTVTVTKELPAKIIYKEPKGIVVSVSISDLENDLSINASHLSSRERKEILEAINATSDVYNISPLILYSIISVESSFRSWITHKQVIINKKKDNAIGLTGILYTWWGKQLTKEKIIETKSDLYTPQINILACGYIFNEMRKLSLLKGTTNKTESALRRYFGGNFKSYSDKIESKIGSIVFKKVYE